MLGMHDQALVDPQSVEALTGSLNKDVAAMREPCMNRLAPGVVDCGEFPSVVFLEPSND